jgi:hypothetical protein
LVFDHLYSWDLTDTDPHVDFTYRAGNQSREFIFTNNSGNAESYLWDFGDGNVSADTNAVHKYASDGIYTVTLTAVNCDLSEMKQQSKQVIIDLNPIIHTSEMMLYPNPTTRFFTVKLPPASIGISYRMIDALGRIIQKGNFTREVNDVDLHAVAAGIYILQTGNVTRKIVKY